MNGYLDAVHVTFSEPILDATVTAANFDVQTVTGEAFSGTTLSDTANDSDIYITFTEGTTWSTEDLPTLAYTAGTLTDAAGNVSANEVAAATSDTAAPYPLTATFYDATSNDGKLDKIIVVWSENISAVASDVASKWAISGANFADITEVALLCNSGAAAADACNYTFTTSTVKTSVGNLTLVYTATGNQITDSVNAVVGDRTFSSAAVSGLTPAFTDAAKPILTAVVAGTSSGANTVAFTYSELMTACDGASTTTCGNLTTAGTFVGMGTFATGGNIVVPTLKNTVAGNGTATLTVTLAGQSGGYMASADVAALTVPSGTVTVTAAAGVYDLASSANTVNPSGAAVTASPLPTAQWDITRPTVTVATFADTYYNNAAFVAGGTFNTGGDGKADTVTLTASETLKTITDAAATRNDWATSTGATNAYGTSWTIINGAASGTTYTINFSGANTYYDPGTFEVINVQDTVPSFVDRAGNPLASGLTAQTYKICYTGYSCASGTIANSAILTNSMTQPGREEGGTDTTPPSVPAGLTAVVNESK
jgi:hypothetical protein